MDYLSMSTLQKESIKLHVENLLQVPYFIIFLPFLPGTVKSAGLSGSKTGAGRAKHRLICKVLCCFTTSFYNPDQVSKTFPYAL